MTAPPMPIYSGSYECRFPICLFASLCIFQYVEKSLGRRASQFICYGMTGWGKIGFDFDGCDVRTWAAIRLRCPLRRKNGFCHSEGMGTLRGILRRYIPAGSAWANLPAVLDEPSRTTDCCFSIRRGNTRTCITQYCDY